MNKFIHSLLIVLLIDFILGLNSYAQGGFQWSLPEDAIARIGKGNVLDVAYSPDGNRIAFSTFTGIWIHNSTTGDEIDMLPGNSVNFIAYSPDGLLLAAGERSGVVLWDTETNTIKDTYGGGNGVAFSPDGRLLATGDGDQVFIWDVNTGQLKMSLNNGGNGVAYSPNGKYVASGGGWDGTIFLWDITIGKLINTEKVHACFTSNVTFSPDSKTLVTSGLDGPGRRGAYLWDTDTGKLRKILPGHGGLTTFSQDGKLLANTMQVWDFATGRIIARLNNFKRESQKIKFSPDGKKIAGSGQIWNSTGGDPIKSFYGYGGGNYTGTVSFSPDGEKLLHTNGSYTKVVDVNNPTRRETLRINGLGPGDQFMITPDWLTYAVNYRDRDSEVINVGDYESNHIFNNLIGQTDVNDIAISTDGNLIASASDDSTVWLWNAKTGQHIHTYNEHDSAVECVTFSPDSNILASGSGNSVWLWNIQSGELIATQDKHTHRVLDVAFSRDGKILASVSYDKTVQFWDPNTLRHSRSLTLHSSTINLSFSPDNNTLAVGLYDGNIILIDYLTGKTITQLEGHGSSIESIDFNPNGDMLASMGSSGTTFLWDLTPYTSKVTSLKGTIKKYEREMVKLIYFRPNDRLQRQTINSELDTLIRWTQYFFSEQMDEYNRKTFAFELEPTGRAKVHHLTGKFPDKHYHHDTSNKVVKEVSDLFDTSKNVYLIIVDVSTEYINEDGTCGVGGGNWITHDNEMWRREYGGFAVIPATGLCVTPSIIAHELGHAFGLQHDFGDITYLMAYGKQTRLSRSARAWLDVHPLFNNDPVFFNTPASIDLQSLTSIDEKELLIKFELTDEDGLHQAQLIVPTTQNDPAKGTKLYGYRALIGKNQVVPFYIDNRVVPIGSEVMLQLIDKTGNIARHTYSIKTQDIIRNIGAPHPSLTYNESNPVTALFPNYPNPFNPETWIPFQLATPAEVQISIYTSDGKVVRTLELGHKPNGLYQDKNLAAHWDGNDDNGESVASGVYYYSLTTDDFSATRKMLILK